VGGVYATPHAAKVVHLVTFGDDPVVFLIVAAMSVNHLIVFREHGVAIRGYGALPNPAWGLVASVLYFVRLVCPTPIVPAHVA
jgi:hypothetical protein